ncbi:class I SAM-dependent methyltransferase [Salinisphaera sp.]|uniref:class I SAM-dependent methyltransferase n=1 Tax=Salinisphaera sp. TaxID=1914330 RepID=UPI002D798818|nr:methyltransferase domain-containing protein [Salinisphaera sp.]HET7313720.1 methyltransferase domain-containing protein [Salinisphaera sp.]
MAHSETTAHSFRRMAENDAEASQQYVFSDNRYTGLMEFLADRIDLPQARVLDLGCGAGVVTRGLAGSAQKAIGIDGNGDNVALARRYADEQGLDNIEFMHASADDLPLESRSLDLVLLNGVLEWVGVNGEGVDPRQKQIKVLREVLRVLRPGGVLYVGIENRFHPGTLWRDPHTQMTLVNALPRRMANVWARRYGASRYQTYIYGHRKSAALLREAGFSRVDKFVPFPSYQFPVAFIRLGSRAQTLADVDAIDVERVRGVMRDSGRADDIEAAVRAVRQRALLGVLGLVAHDHAFIATKR